MDVYLFVFFFFVTKRPDWIIFTNQKVSLSKAEAGQHTLKWQFPP